MPRKQAVKADSVLPKAQKSAVKTLKQLPVGPVTAESGRFQPGTSGNPAGRPIGAKNAVTRLKVELELAVRTHNNAPTAEKVVAVLQEVYNAAMDGSRQAQKLYLDYTLSKPRDSEEDADNKAREYRFLVVDARQASREEPKPISGETFDNPPQDS